MALKLLTAFVAFGQFSAGQDIDTTKVNEFPDWSRNILTQSNVKSKSSCCGKKVGTNSAWTEGAITIVDRCLVQ